MYASEEPSTLRRIAEITSWVLLFLVVFPGTTLGYFAENSLPNTPLYPLKIDIEKAILTLTSVNNSAKTTYELELARIRVNEAQQLFSSNKQLTSKDIQQLDIVAAQLDDTRVAINNVNDPVQKQQLQQQLNATTQSYKNQLSNLQQQLNSVTTNTTPRGAITPTIIQTTNSTSVTQPPTTENTPENNTQQNSSNTSSNLNSLSTDDAALLQQTIDTVSTQLDTFTPPPSPSTQPQDSTQLPTPTSPPFFPFHQKDSKSHQHSSHDGENR